MVVKLYVGNLSYETTEEALRTLFAQAGTVVSVAVIKDRDTGSSKGFGFVEMSSQQEAQAAQQQQMVDAAPAISSLVKPMMQGARA